MAKIITVANQKGGVAKTATCRYFADICVDKGKKVLLIDFDPQASLTKGFGLNPELFEGVNEGNICNIFKQEPVEIVSFGEENETLHLIPSNRELGLVGQEVLGKDLMLKKFIKKNKLDKLYDIIIIDNNPKFDSMTINTILASTIIVIPVVTSKDEQEGLHGFFKNTEDTLSIYDHSVKKIVIIPSRYNKLTKVSKEYLRIIQEDQISLIERECPTIKESKVFVSKPVPEKVAFPDASSYNMSVFKYLSKYGSQSSMKKDKREKLLSLLEEIVMKTIK